MLLVDNWTSGSEVIVRDGQKQKNVLIIAKSHRRSMCQKGGAGGLHGVRRRVREARLVVVPSSSCYGEYANEIQTHLEQLGVHGRIVADFVGCTPVLNTGRIRCVGISGGHRVVVTVQPFSTEGVCCVFALLCRNSAEAKAIRAKINQREEADMGETDQASVLEAGDGAVPEGAEAPDIVERLYEAPVEGAAETADADSAAEVAAANGQTDASPEVAVATALSLEDIRALPDDVGFLTRVVAAFVAQAGADGVLLIPEISAIVRSSADFTGYSVEAISQNVVRRIWENERAPKAPFSREAKSSRRIEFRLNRFGKEIAAEPAGAGSSRFAGAGVGTLRRGDRGLPRSSDRGSQAGG
ncbi:MAG: hypothetical protein BWY68_00108 [bacterium ADurb.Bin400]|nr:MAG: hypothetical protein BWY68_00108 [bacterium ADurb.Bin400]